MAERESLLLGNQALYNVSREVEEEELPKVREVVLDLQDTMLGFRAKYGFGRAITAPRIGEFFKNHLYESGWSILSDY